MRLLQEISEVIRMVVVVVVYW
uniref:Uncharacterized protein n=1 Tax=Arundo donax TaxID=35708 RepID=A0A0A9BWM1_ARUDO